MTDAPFDRRLPVSRRACLALPLVTVTSVIAHSHSRLRPDNRVSHLRPESTIGDLLRHPAFAAFARLLLPWDDRPYDEATELRAFDTLLPYHSHVDAASIVGALNRLIGDAGQG